MKEVVFLKQNADKWKRFESLIKNPSKVDSDELASLYIELTDDLSYAKTFYPKSKTTIYLNGLAQKVHHAIYKNKKENRGRIITFWKDEVPTAVYNARAELRLALIIFLVAVGIGIISTLNDDRFVRLVLGDEYINMTLENIQSGDPMAVYKQTNELDMFLGITINNVRVSFLAFVAGILFSVGTGYILFTNGIMLGSFQTMFYTHDILWESMLTIWIHGTLEISAIIIAGGAGLSMGNSLLFPGTFSRKDALLKGTKRGLKIVMGTVPIFIIAGFLEGFVTRHTDMPVFLSLTIIGLSLSLIIGYFVLYPWWLHRTKNTDTHQKSIS